MRMISSGAVELEARRDDVRVREVAKVPAHLAIACEQAERAAVSRVEQAREDRRRIEPRETQPLDRGRGRHQREDPPVADHAVIERGYVKRRGRGDHLVLVGR
jgi:hypothetical protein